MARRKLLIGVDVGGTNTDSVILDPTTVQRNGQGLLAWHKAATTADVSDGIISAIKALFEQAPDIVPDDIASVTIGTTHFINAVIERDRSRLVPVAVMRLSGPYGRLQPPFCDFPPSLARILNGHISLLDGGFKVDGALVKPVNIDEVRNECRLIRDKGIKSVVIIGNFSPMDHSHEDQVARIVAEEIPHAHIVRSHEVANIGFLERENAAILNAAILPFAKKIVSSFKAAVKSLGIKAPILLTQNDGTVLPADLAAKVPIRSFSSGATNSMRGASFLCAHDTALKGKSIVVMDIGGTTTDVGMLLPNGFPRQAASYSAVGGVRMNFPMPFVESVGFGGGSIVRETDGEMTIGPDSVGSDILSKAILFGGETVTATDARIAAGILKGDRSLLSGMPNQKSSALSALNPESCQKFEKKACEILESALDRIKTSPDPVPVLLVGGGSILAPNKLKGASRVIRPNFYGVANAIGAAISKVSAVIDTIAEASNKDELEALKDKFCEQAIEVAVESKAVRTSVMIADVEAIPLPYVMNKIRLIIKAVGDLDYDQLKGPDCEPDEEIEMSGGEIIKDSASSGDDTSRIEDGSSIAALFDIENYKPKINQDREWIVSELDLEFIALGAYILGAGGGGSPYPVFLRIRELLRKGSEIKVVDIFELLERNQKLGINGKIVSCGNAGSPTVGVEQIVGPEQEEAFDTFTKFVCPYDPPQAVISIEIGGGNGIESLKLGATKGLLCVDADLMGRAFPTLWQTTPSVYSDKCVLTPSAFSDGNGNNGFFSNAESAVVLEKMIRATLSQLGARVGTINGYNDLEDMARWSITNTTSQAWRIGRAVFLARQKNMVDDVSRLVIDANGGPKSGREIFRGKIMRVDRRLEGGYSVGDVHIQSHNKFSKSGKPFQMIIPFKNENISAELVDPESGARSLIATVPDLICLLDTQNGANIGNAEFRYGVNVSVLVLACSPKWTSSEQGLKIGGPESFNLSHKYKSCGTYVEPRSVIEEYYVSA